LLREGADNRLELAEKLSINPRTLGRLLADLRAEGHVIVSVCQGRTWRYRLEGSPEKEGTQ